MACSPAFAIDHYSAKTYKELGDAPGRISMIGSSLRSNSLAAPGPRSLRSGSRSYSSPGAAKHGLKTPTIMPVPDKAGRLPMEGSSLGEVTMTRAPAQRRL